MNYDERRENTFDLPLNVNTEKKIIHGVIERVSLYIKILYFINYNIGCKKEMIIQQSEAR